MGKVQGPVEEELTISRSGAKSSGTANSCFPQISQIKYTQISLI